MGIYHHKSRGFDGLRVCRQVDKVTIQKYYSLSGLSKAEQKLVRKKAERFDERLRRDQERLGKRKDFGYKASARNPHKLGIRGLSESHVPNKQGGHRKYYNVALRSEVTGEMMRKRFNQDKLGRREAREAAIRFVAKHRGVTVKKLMISIGG